MGRCREWCRGADEPEFAKHALLEIRKSSALSRAPAGPRDRDAANDTEIGVRHVLKPDRLPMLHEPLRGRGGLEIHALRRELVGIDTQVRKTLAQIGNRREQELAVVKCAQADRDLWRIGVVLYDASAPPFVKLAEPLGGDIRANEIRDAVENRADIDLRLGQSAPYPLAYDGLRAIAPGPSRIATLVHFAPSGQSCNRRAHNAISLKSPSDAQREIFAPRGGDDLHADRKLFALCPDRGRDDGQSDEGYRLSEEPDIRSHQHFPAVEHKGRLLEPGGAARGRWRQQDIDVAKERERRRMKLTAEFLRLRGPGARNHSPSDKPVANFRNEVLSPFAKPSKMERATFDHRDEIGCGTRLLGPGEFDDTVRF